MVGQNRGFLLKERELKISHTLSPFPKKFLPLPLHRRPTYTAAGNYILKGVTCALFW